MSGSRAWAGSASRSRAFGNPWAGSVRPLRTAHGTEHVPCPLTQTWDAAIVVRDVVNRVLGFKVFIIPVLLFSDTPQDQTIEEWATQRRVKVLFGSDGLIGRLLERADGVGVKYPPTAGHIRHEVAAVANGLVAPARDGGGHEAVQEFMARQVVIQHVDTVNIHVTSAHAGGRDPQGCLQPDLSPRLRRPVQGGHRAWQ